TEKVAFEVEAPQSGFLAKILAQVDEVVPIGGVVGLLIEKEGEKVEVIPQKPEAVPEGVEKKILEVRPERAEKIRATPMAKKIAKERGIDLKTVSGSGIGGRIKSKDVETILNIRSSEQILPRIGEEKLVKLSGMRRIIAQKMLASKIETAQTYMTISVDTTNILASRERLAPVIEKMAGVHLTITDILMKITASAISLHPVINTRWTPEGILWLDAVHMGMAMAIEEGLIVPVIWDIGKKSLSETAKARAALIEKGRIGKLTPDEMKGSTFTLSSLGMYGVEEFIAIINQPESAILAVGAILDKPVVINKEVVIRPMMNLTLSYDHRVIDGAKAAQFMKTLKGLMEDPILTLA
ncbi:MAG TPA: dihydrolipoamide acetyltransferase family protein, partial [Thermodesulfobacteriota bacterium]|nr:dihydrolipoamide acetyltransferase family protein [Thermodesulfobacteriota bacterium]